MTWFAQVDDLIGGWMVCNRDVPASQIGREDGDRVIGEFMSEEDARRVARLLNEEEK